MKYFLLLVQEKGVKIPAPVWEVVAPAAAAAAPPPPPCQSVVLNGMFDSQSRCFAPKVPLSDELLCCSRILHTLAPQIPANLLAKPAPLLSTTYTQKSMNKNMFLRETLPRMNEVFV